MNANADMKKMQADPHGRLADNIVYFARALRKAGLRVGPASVTDAIEAVLAAGIGTRDDFYWTLHSVLITKHEDTVVFDEAFRLFWRSRELIEKMLAMFSPQAPNNKEREKQRAGESRVADAMFEGHRKHMETELPPEIEVDAHMTASGREVLRAMDFARMNAAELAAAKAAKGSPRTQGAKGATTTSTGKSGGKSARGRSTSQARQASRKSSGARNQAKRDTR